MTAPPVVSQHHRAEPTCVAAGHAADTRYINCVPLVPLQAAAGVFSDPQSVLDESEWDWDWVEVDTRHTLRSGMFVA